MLLCHVAIPAKNLQVCRVIVLYDPSPPVTRKNFIPVFFPIIMNMIYRQEWHLRFATTHTLSPIVHKHIYAPLAVLFCDIGAPPAFVFWARHPSGVNVRATLTFRAVFSRWLSTPANPLRRSRSLSSSPFFGAIMTLAFVGQSRIRTIGTPTTLFSCIAVSLGFFFSQGRHNSNIIPLASIMAA